MLNTFEILLAEFHVNCSYNAVNKFFSVRGVVYWFTPVDFSRRKEVWSDSKELLATFNNVAKYQAFILCLETDKRIKSPPILINSDLQLVIVRFNDLTKRFSLDVEKCSRFRNTTHCVVFSDEDRNCCCPYNPFGEAILSDLERYNNSVAVEKYPRVRNTTNCAIFSAEGRNCCCPYNPFGEAILSDLERYNNSVVVEKYHRVRNTTSCGIFSAEDRNCCCPYNPFGEAILSYLERYNNSVAVDNCPYPLIRLLDPIRAIFDMKYTLLWMLSRSEDK